MPLLMLGKGKRAVITKQVANEKLSRHLDSLGLSEGAEVRIVSEYAGDLILQVFSSRIAVSKSVALKVMVEQIA